MSLFNNSGSTDVVVDVNGWFTDATNMVGGSGFVATLPTRIFDSRMNSAGPLGPGGDLAITLTNSGNITALVMNVTATDTTAPSFLTVYPNSLPRPLASDLNFVAGQTVPNLVEVELVFPRFDVYNSAGQVDVVIDVDGFFSGPIQPVSSAAFSVSASGGEVEAKGAGPTLRPTVAFRKRHA